ncbi:MAG: sigma 54-interacting transcriptional regulator [Peptococcaceae bacterium]|nr:sigma 54-interacting transcriptional regulator [Peptococcaceae bacterium]
MIRKGGIPVEKRFKFISDIDILGMVHGILGIARDLDINVMAVEVKRYTYLKVYWRPHIPWREFCRRVMEEYPVVYDIVEVDLMEFEKQSRELETIIDNIDEIVLATNKEGRITFHNQLAQKIFDHKDGKGLAGRLYSEVLPITVDLQGLRGEKYNLDFIYKREQKKETYLAEIIPMDSGQKRIIGYLFIIKDMKKVRSLYNALSRPAMYTFEDIIGSSRGIKNAINLGLQAARSNSSILLYGESGTGKELFARAIHQSSRRHQGLFVAANCASIPDSLMESEFFGYEKGAFTGASNTGKPGLFEMASEGTLFLDEIGDMPLILQAKILRAIQERKIRRVGGVQEVDIDIRIISATNKNLEEMVAQNSFRKDLYFRLNVIPIFIPPLRQRREDVLPLARYFLATLAKEAEKPDLKISGEAMSFLEQYDWPGNIRELRNVIERAVYLADHTIRREHLMLDNNSSLGSGGVPEEEKAKGVDRGQELTRSLPVSLNDEIARLEKEYLTGALKQASSSRDIAALLGISHTSVIQKIRKYGLAKGL